MLARALCFSPDWSIHGLQMNDAIEGSDGILAAGSKVGGGRFTLIRQVGKGSMGSVWLARDEQAGEEVALKMLAPALTFNPAALDSLRRETMKSSKLSHPNILRIHQLFHSRNEPAFISMEFTGGDPLCALKEQQEKKCFRWDQLEQLARQMCAALEHAHEQKIIHRDFKPSNLMVAPTGTLKLTDFGVAATAANTLGQVTSNMGTTGTFCFMSPQQMEGRAPKPTDDIYSLGATLYELLVSQPPFHAFDGLQDAGTIFNKVRTIAPKPLEQRLAELGITNPMPPRVSTVILTCLAKDPASRPPSARAAAELLGVLKATDAPPANDQKPVASKVESEAFQSPSPEESNPPPASPPRKMRFLNWLKPR